MLSTNSKTKQQQETLSKSKGKISSGTDVRKELGSSLVNFSGNHSCAYSKKRST